MKAIGHYVIIDEIKEAVKKVGGLELTDAHTDDIRYIKAKVISVGTLVKGVEADDVILFDRHQGHGIELNDKFYKVIQEGNIVLVL